MPDQGSQFKKLSTGLLLVVLGTFLIVARGDNNTKSTKTFADEPVNAQGFHKHEQIVRYPKRIIIPEVSIDLEIQEALAVNGYWEVFDDKAGWGEGSGIPGENGNQVVFAHAREGLFKPLGDIEQGASVYILTKNEIQGDSELQGDLPNERGDWYEYEVVEIKEVLPSQIEVIAPTEEEILTLYTCSGFGDQKRLVIVAERKT